jgi:YbbR domain-containing protein
MRDLFFKDLGWKIFSLLLAAGIWFTANRILHEKNSPDTDTSTSTFHYDNLPVTLVSAGADVRGFHAAPATVKVIVSGPVAAMTQLQANELHATANVTGAALTSGKLVDVEISAPAQIAVTGIEPDKIFVTPPAGKN